MPWPWVWPHIRGVPPARALEILESSLDKLQRVLTTPEPLITPLRNVGNVYTPDMSRAVVRTFEIVATSATPFTVNRPKGFQSGAILTIAVLNQTAGALGAITWDSSYLFLTSFTSPPAGGRTNVTFYCGPSALAQIANQPAAAGAGGGETNTASNVGSAGIGIYDGKVGVDLQFRALNPASALISVALDAVNKKVDLDLGSLAAVSVLGRSANSIGPMAAISAAADDRLLARTGGAVAFSQLTAGMVPANLVTYALMQQISATQRVLGRNTPGAGNAEEVTASQVLDWISATRGSVLFRGASGWSALAPGAAQSVLTSAGTGADPSYQTPTVQVLSAADQATFNSTQQNITSLSFAVAPSETWLVDVTLSATMVLTTGVKFYFTFPVSCTGEMHILGNVAALASWQSLYQAVLTVPGTFFLTAAMTGTMQIVATIRNGANSGTIQLVGITGGATTTCAVKKGSMLLARRV